jgi:serine/threonine protein kinase
MREESPYEAGDELPYLLKDGSSLTILSELGEGGQGFVYKVRLARDGSLKALKVYKLNYLFAMRKEKQEAFMNSIVEKTLSKEKIPSAFIWPEEIFFDKKKKYFGYLMKLIPPEFIDFSHQIVNMNELGANGKPFLDVCNPLVDACFNLVLQFKLLRGYSFQDLNDGSLYFNPKTHDVLICDAENIIIDRDLANITLMGKPGYMAPEVASQKAPPSQTSDEYSLSVLLFYLLFGMHPLLGQRYRTSQDWKTCMVDDPLYVLDSRDQSNAPELAAHPFYARYKNFYPKDVMDLFETAFTDGLTESRGRPASASVGSTTQSAASKRVHYYQWLDLFAHLKDEILICPKCKAESFLPKGSVSKDSKATCPICHASFYPPLFLHSHPVNHRKGDNILIESGKTFYQWHLKPDDDFSSDSFTSEGTFESDTKGRWFLRNQSSDDLYQWRFAYGGQEQVVHVGEKCPLPYGAEISIASSGDPRNPIKFDVR